MLALLALAGFFSGCSCDEPAAECMGEVGSLACQCQPDQSCDEGLACSEGLCVNVELRALTLPAGARGCDILIADQGGALDVMFGESAEGTFVREAPRVAISVIATSDTDFLATAVQVNATAPFTIESSSCVDAAGAALSGAEVSLP